VKIKVEVEFDTEKAQDEELMQRLLELIEELREQLE
jgi:quinol monooxygenase YgiN